MYECFGDDFRLLDYLEYLYSLYSLLHVNTFPNPIRRQKRLAAGILNDVRAAIVYNHKLVYGSIYLHYSSKLSKYP